MEVDLDEEDRARLDALVARLPVATRESLARHALRLGLDALAEDPTRALRTAGGSRIAIPDDDAREALCEAAVAYAEARQRAAGRAFKVAQAREAFDHAVDDYLAAVGSPKT